MYYWLLLIVIANAATLNRNERLHDFVGENVVHVKPKQLQPCYEHAIIKSNDRTNEHRKRVILYNYFLLLLHLQNRNA